LKVGLALALARGPAPATSGAGAETGPAEMAHALIDALLARDLEGLCKLTPPPFSFDGVEARNRDEVRRAWTRVLQRHSMAGRKLEGLEVMSYEELVKRHGPPPARLASPALVGSEAVIAEVGGRSTIILMKKRGTAYVPIAITD
jgi:hypothetical protein